MKIIYQNFDALEVSFQCALPRALLVQLSVAKKRAQDISGKVVDNIGPNSLQVMVHEKGTRGSGYTYQFSTGPTGEIWMIRDNEANDLWNVRVKVRALKLALIGYEQTRYEIWDILINDLLAKGPEGGEPIERISRVDYCIDFVMLEPFQPTYKNFVCHGRTKKNERGKLEYDQIATGQGVETLTVGKMPNRQVTLYNKLKEISVSHKSYMWQFWGIEKEEFNKEIWRLEIRAAKKELNKWNLRRFGDLEQIIGNVFLKILNDYKYTKPNLNDKSPHRWPKSTLWLKAENAIKKNLFNYISKTNEEIILKIIKNEAQDQCEKAIKGYLMRLGAIMGKDASEIPGVLELVEAQLLEEIAENPHRFAQKYNKKEEKIGFLGEKKSEN